MTGAASAGTVARRNQRAMRRMPKLLKVLLVAGSIVTAGGPVRAACPDERTAPLGYKLENHDPAGSNIEVLPFEGETVRFVSSRSTDGGVSTEEFTTWRGLLNLRVKAKVDFEFSFDHDYRVLFPLKAGNSLTTRFTMRSGDRERKAAFKVLIGEGTTTIALGDCSYEVWKVSRHGDFDDGERYLIVDYYSPVLAMWLRRDVVLVRPGQAISLITFAYKGIIGR
jgi:hypothetical protein